jgi:hypothetical protein
MSGPYPPTTAAPGGTPTTSIDVPICTIFMLLYIIGFIIHVLIFRHNRNAKRPFRLSILLIYICFFRTVTMSLRMAWTTHLMNIGLVITAQVFVTAGVLLLFILNLIFAQRLLRAMHPRIGWHAITSRLFVAFYVLVGLSLVSVITCFVQSLYTLDPHTRQVDHAVTLYGGTFFLVAAFFPVPFVGVNYLAFVAKRKEGTGRAQGPDTDKMIPPQRPRMAGSVARGSIVLGVAALLLTLGAGFRTGVAYAQTRPAEDPAWYDSKACFYVFNFVTELGVIYLYAMARVDRTFYVPAVEVERERSKEAA